MAVIGNDEAVIPSVFVFPRLDIERRYFFRIPEIRIHSVVNHLYFFIRNSVDQPERIHGVIGYAVIQVIGEAENSLFKKFIEPASPSSFVRFP